MDEYWFWLGADAEAFRGPTDETLLALAHCLPEGVDLTDPASDE